MIKEEIICGCCLFYSLSNYSDFVTTHMSYLNHGVRLWKLMPTFAQPNRTAQAQHVQHDLCVNKNSIVLRHVPIDSACLLQSCLLFK